MSALSTPVLNKSIRVTADVSAYRFITWAGNVQTAGNQAAGPTRYAAKNGDLVDVVVLGTATVEAGGAISVGAEVMAGSGGKAYDWASGNTAVGIALEAATADGDLIEVFVISRGS